MGKSYTSSAVNLTRRLKYDFSSKYLNKVLSLIFALDLKPVKIYDNILESKKRYNKRI